MNKVFAGILVCFLANVCVAQAVWIDVREPSEFARGHHPAAVNIPYTVIGEKISAVTADKNADIRVYCRSGRRSGLAKKALDAAGYVNVTNEGGYARVMRKISK